MHALHRKSIHAVLLLSLGGVGCGLIDGIDKPNPTPTNHAPTLSMVMATPASVDEGKSTTLSATAADEDGDTLKYTWTQTPDTPAGTFGGEAGAASRTWTAPGVPANTTFTLQVTVSDGKSETSATVDVAVMNVPTANRAPTVDAAITPPANPVIAGDTLDLSIGATDPDGDMLTYSWTVTNPAGTGTFTNPTAAAARWRTPEIGTATTYTLQVTVSDGKESVTRSVDVQVGIPSYANHIQPIWTAQCTGCHNSSSSTRGGLNLDAGQSYTSIVSKPGAGTYPSTCGSTTRVVKKDPDNSLLVKKISGTACGGRMPQGNTAYFDDHPGELTRIRSWILADAPNN